MLLSRAVGDGQIRIHPVCFGVDRKRFAVDVDVAEVLVEVPAEVRLVVVGEVLVRGPGDDVGHLRAGGGVWGCGGFEDSVQAEFWGWGEFCCGEQDSELAVVFESGVDLLEECGVECVLLGPVVVGGGAGVDAADADVLVADGVECV